MLRFSELRAANLERLDQFHPIEDWTPLEWAGCMCGEAGEAANLAKKLRRGDDITAAQICREVADTIIYADLLCARLGIDLGQCVVDTFNNKSREMGVNVMLVPEGMTP